MKRNNFPFTSDEIRAAYSTSVIDLAVSYGYQLKAERNVFRVSNISGGLYIWGNGLGYYRHDSGEKGNNVQFLMNYCGAAKSSDAIRLLLNAANITPAKEIVMNNEPKKPKGNIELPEKFDGNYKNLYWYLITKRCIDKDIVYKCLQDKSIYQDTHRNVVFCGFDLQGNVKYASLRGTVEYPNKQPFKGEVFNSDKHFGFHINGSSERLYVFESPIDAMSHATLFKLAGLDWQKDNRVSLGGTADLALKQYLHDYPHIKQLIFCLDNDYYKYSNNLHCFDNVGQNAIIKHAANYHDKYKIGKSLPALPYKDFNEYLVGTIHPELAQSCKQKALESFEEHGEPNKFFEYFPQQTEVEEVGIEI